MLITVKLTGLLFSLGLNYVWIFQDASSVSFDFVKQRIIDQFVQQWSTSVYDREKTVYL